MFCGRAFFTIAAFWIASSLDCAFANNVGQTGAKTTTTTIPIAECRIYSDMYKVYMYASYVFLGISPTRPVKMWREKTMSGRLRFDDQDTSGVWYLDAVAGRKHTFYIRNKKYEKEYLRASDEYQEFFVKKNRGVYVAEMDDDIDENEPDESFMWTLSHVPNTHLFFIWNVKFGLPLYTRENFSSRGGPSWTVSIWNVHRPASQQFEWNLKCRHGNQAKLAAQK